MHMILITLNIEYMHHVVRTQVQHEIKFTTHVHRLFEKKLATCIENTPSHFLLGFSFDFGFGFSGGNGR